MNIGVFASHGGSNLQAIIDACKENQIDANVSVVISNNSNSYALERATKAGIPTYHISSKKYSDPRELENIMINTLKKHNVEFIVLAGYMRKLGSNILNEYRGKIINIHPSLLPKHGGKGMYGIKVHQAVINSNDAFTGVTIHLVDERYDTGPIIGQSKVVVQKNDTPQTLAERVLEREHTFLVETIKLITEGKLNLSDYLPNP